jgi:hypothetical protein
MVAEALLAAGITDEEPVLLAAAQWVSRNFDSEWLLARSLASGIGIHNGRIPRSLAQFMVRAFNEGSIRFLACTSTLIEGVNTAAKNVIIFDNRISTKRFDYFTFNNIRGRTGRMFRHFVGRVFLFYPPPEPELPLVDVPALTQPSSAPASLLIQLDETDLTPESRSRLRPIMEQRDLTLDVIRQNNGISPEQQVQVAHELRQEASSLHPRLAWRGYPTWEQLSRTCEYVWQLSGFRSRTSGVSSGRQLAFMLNQLRQHSRTKDFINALAERDSRQSLTADERVESALEFIRQWVGHHAPRYFLSLDKIQREVFESQGLQAGDYSFARSVSTPTIGRTRGVRAPSGRCRQVAISSYPW